MAITVGSVEVDVVPNTKGIYQHLRAGIVPAATRAGEDGGKAAGRAFGPAMAGAVSDTIAAQIGHNLGQQIATQIAAQVRDALRSGVTVGGRQARPAATRSGEETGGAFGRAFRSRLQAAMQNLPRADVRISDTGFDADMARLRAKLETLSNKRIGVDVSAAAALAEIDRLEAELTRLGAQHPDVNVRVDTAAATAQLAALRAEIARMDGQDINVRADVDASSATASLGGLTSAALLFGPAILPVLPIVAAGLGAIAAAGVAAGVGLASVAAVALPGITQIAGALQAQKAATDAAASATGNGAAVAARASSRALQLAGAQQALATAERNGARQIAQAQQQVTQAKQAAADAIAQAAQRNEQAARQVQDAEKNLATAQKDAKQAQADLTAARKEAGQELEDLANRYADAKLSQRDAELAVQEAAIRLNEVNAAGSKATRLERQQAQLAYDQAVQRLKEQTTDTKRLKAEQSAASKAGIKGTDVYKSAQDRLAQAQQEVADRTQAVRDAQDEAARTQVETSRQVAEAQRRVSEAIGNVAVAQQNAADAVASAQRQIQSAQAASVTSASAAETAQAKYRRELAKMSPATRNTFNAFLDLRDAFKAWSRELQPAVMPLFTRALIGLRNSLPGLTPFVLAAARAIKSLQDRVSAGFDSPWWLTFKKDLAGSIEPAIVGLGVSFGRIFKGMAGIIDAFLPHMAGISSTMQRITKRFSDWASNLRGSPEFEGFLAYVQANAPRVGDFLGKVMTALLAFSQAIAPTSQVIFAVVGPLLDGLIWLSTNMPGLVQTLWGLYAVSKAVAVATKLWSFAEIAFAAAMQLATAETWSFSAALNTTGIPELIIGITLLIAALVAGVIYAWKHWGWFHDAVLAAWTGIKVAALFVWNSVLKPTFEAIWIGLQTIGRWAMWLWTHAIGPAFRFIWSAAKILATILIVLVIGPMVLGFKVFGAVAMWLWTHAIRPAFGWIGGKAVWLYKSILKPQFDAMVAVFRALGAAGMWLWNHSIKPAFGWIADKAVWLYAHVIRPQFEAFKRVLHVAGDAASWLWKNAIRPAFGWIADKGLWLWTHALKPAFGFIKTGIDQVGKAFKSAKDFIGRQWSQVADIAKKPVKFIVDTVYNHGIVPLWNRVAGITGAKKLESLALKGWATGGVLPGYTPGRDVHTFVSPTGGALALSGGEAVMRPEFTRAIGPSAINSLNAVARSGGVSGVQRALGMPGLAGGGFIDWLGDKATSVGHGIKSAVTTGVDWAKSGTDLLLHPGKIWDKLSSPIRDLIAKIGSNKWAKLIAGVPTAFVKGLKDKLVDLVGLGGGAANVGAPGGSGVQRWGSVVLKALGLVGQPASLKQTVLRRMNQESGGNPNIVNKWDSNWIAGHPSVGLMQVIAGTFKAYAGQFKNTGPFSYGVSTNPLANVYASMRYAMSRYGSLANAYNRPGGYDSGGYLQPGLNLAYNGTGRPEPVFTTSQANALTRLAAAPATGGGTFEGDLYLDSGEWLGKVRGEVQQQMAGLTAVLRAGRKG